MRHLQISAGSCTGVGGYQKTVVEHESTSNTNNGQQFEPSDQRSPNEIIRMLCERGFVPSYCTACYRQGRTGDRFMSLAKDGTIQNVCLPNALLTFKEYLIDYATRPPRSSVKNVSRKPWPPSPRTASAT